MVITMAMIVMVVISAMMAAVITTVFMMATIVIGIGNAEAGVGCQSSDCHWNNQFHH
jgi:hypothetical protein